MERDEIVWPPPKTCSGGVGVFVGRPPQRPRPHALYGRFTHSSLDEILAHAVRIDRNPCGTAGQRKLKSAYRTGDACTPFHTRLQRGLADYVVKHQCIRSAEYPTGNRCVRQLDVGEMPMMTSGRRREGRAVKPLAKMIASYRARRAAVWLAGM